MLTLPIKRKWFDMIVSGEKREEYREKDIYWETRLEHAFGVPVFRAIADERCVQIRIRNGYRSDCPSILAAVTLHIGPGRSEWGAVPGQFYFRLHIHDFIWEVKR